MGALEYHLAELERAGLVSCLKEERKRYFPVQVPPSDRPRLALIRQELPRRILRALLETPVITTLQLEDATGAAHSTLNYRLRQMTRAGLLEAGREAHDTTYSLCDAEAALRLLTTYRAGLLDQWVDGFLDATGALR